VDLSCIISSGDLELYVLGLLTEEEAYKVEQLAILFPEVKAELDRISQTLEDLANTTAASPSPELKAKVMEKISAMNKDGQPAVQTQPAASPLSQDKENTGAIVVPMGATGRQGPAWLRAAAIIGLVATTGAAIYFFQQNRRQQTEVAQLNQRVDTLQRSISLQQQQLFASNQTLQIFQSADYRRLNLTSVPGKPAAVAQLFWNTKTKEVDIADVSLPQAPAGKQYQLWAIVNGQPVDAGMLSGQKNYAQKMKVFATADAFAITLEKEGGSPAPTMQEMYVMAKAT
jgi:anti-sigma-K factor RskA